jgi:hypothetical protein
MEAHPGVTEAHHGVMEAHPGVTEDHPGICELTKLEKNCIYLSRNMECRDQRKICGYPPLDKMEVDVSFIT